VVAERRAGDSAYSAMISLSKNHLAYFVCVAEEEQISSAARALYIAQPALSQAIARLERQLGVQLLERHSRGVTLTVAGAVLFEKAKRAVQAETEVVATARSLARSRKRMIEVGFLGSPPPLIAPELLSGFATACPEAEVCFRELRFPTSSTADWLMDVDVALCYSPIADRDVEIHTLWEEPRCVLMHDSHPLAVRTELEVLDVLDEPFCGAHPSVEESWAGFWNLEDHRGCPPEILTGDTPANYMEVVAALTSGRAISTFPMAVAETVAALVPSLVALPLLDAAPATCALVWRGQPENSLTSLFVESARASVTGLAPEPRRPSLV
jgi:DNA-binding transcriptional LysR family regulator